MQSGVDFWRLQISKAQLALSPGFAQCHVKLQVGHLLAHVHHTLSVQTYCVSQHPGRFQCDRLNPQLLRCRIDPQLGSDRHLHRRRVLTTFQPGLHGQRNAAVIQVDVRRLQVDDFYSRSVATFGRHNLENRIGHQQVPNIQHQRSGRRGLISGHFGLTSLFAFLPPLRVDGIQLRITQLNLVYGRLFGLGLQGHYQTVDRQFSHLYRARQQGDEL